MKLSLQRKIAARILKCGENRIWMDQTRLKEIEQAITASDVKSLIKKGYIKKLPVKGISRGRKREKLIQKKKGRRRGHGSRKGTRIEKKRLWIKRIRALRKYLRELKEKGKIASRTYRELYRKAKGGMFKSKTHLKLYIDKNDLWEQKKTKGKGTMKK
jgi:large subunit ribosomal protein L19e